MFRLFECCALSFFERFVLSLFLKIERFVSDSAEIWICGLYLSSLQRQFREGHVFFLAEKDGVPAGYVSVQPESGTLFHLQKLYVHPAFQATGVGRALFLHALSYARGCGAARVELNVNRHNSALAFYRKMGMIVHREVDNPIGEGFYMNDYIMTIDL